MSFLFKRFAKKFSQKIRVRPHYPEDMDTVLGYITCPDRENAKEIAKELLEKRLIACANILPMESVYWWEGKVEDQTECVLIGKTSREKFAAMKDAVLEIHPYETPCVIRIEAAANPEYAAWLEGELSRQ